MKTVLYTNTNTKKCIWLSETHVYESDGSDNMYDVMATTHLMIDEEQNPDMIEGIRLLLKANGTPI